MPNIPGQVGYVQPGVYSRVRSIRRAISIPGGLRVLAIIGLGAAQETVVLSAKGGGADGVNPDFSGSNAPDGRHFVLSKYPLVLKRTTLILNGIPLSGIEGVIGVEPFNSKYDYRMESVTGRIELQSAFLVDQGGEYALASDANIGNGSISLVDLVDINAPSETWTIKAISVIRDAYGDPVSTKTTFSAIGSVSGQPLDAYGNPIVWMSDGALVSNGIIKFAVNEDSVPFDRGDRFTIRVSSRVLAEGDTLEATYIAEADVNDPQFFVDANSLFQKHGFPSLANTLSLGAQMAFENGAFGVMALQAKPPIPRRLSEVLLAVDNPLSSEEGGFPVVADGDPEPFEYPITTGRPDLDSAIHFFVTNRDSGEEEQIILNKEPFYTFTESNVYSGFITAKNYSYTLIEMPLVLQEGSDGYTNASTFTAASGYFIDPQDIERQSESVVGKTIRILDTNANGQLVTAIAGDYEIVSVVTGSTTQVTVTPAFPVSLPDLRWELIDPDSTETTPEFVFTKDLYTNSVIVRGDGLRITFIDENDASFYDSNWFEAFEQLEAVDCQIVVPLPNATVSNIQRASINHCELMSNTANQRERATLIGAMQGITSDALTGLELVAVEDIGVLEGIQGDDPEEILLSNIEDLANYDVRQNFGDTFRAVYFWPDQIIRAVNGTNEYIDGFYMAAAAGGLLAATANVAIPLTRKVLTGFTIDRSRVRRPITLNALGDHGVSVVQPVTGGGQILHCKTTTSSGDPLEEEPSVVFIRDKVARSLRDALSGFIGQPQDPTLIASVTSVVVKVLQALSAQGLIVNFRNINVARDDVDPRQFNVSCEVEPNLPLDWIFVDLNVGIL